MLLLLHQLVAAMSLELNTGAEMPIVGLGTWQGKGEDEEAALDRALAIGYRHVDTAASYGNEEAIGRVLGRWMSSGRLSREEVFVVTKLPIVGVHPERVEMFMRRSLELLRLDYVDLYLVHFPVGCRYRGEGVYKPLRENGEADLEGRTDFAGLWREMEGQVKKGRARAIGVSNFNADQIAAILKIAEIPPSNNQIEMHLYLQQKQLVDYCKKNNITVAAYAPLGSPSYNQFLKSYGKEQRPIPSIFENPTVKEVARKHGKTAGQVAIRFLIQQEVAVLPKSTHEKRLRENFEVFDFSLDDEDLKQLEALDLGEAGRIFTFGTFPGIEKHPDFPF